MKIAAIILGLAVAALAVEQAPGPVRKDRNAIRRDKGNVRHDDRRINRDEGRLRHDYRDGARRGEIRQDKYRLNRDEGRLHRDQRDERRDYRQYNRVRLTRYPNELRANHP
jgi:hypothetical protein